MDVDNDAQAVYRAMLSDRALGVAELVDACGMDEDRVRRALDVLAEQALLAADPDDPMILHPRSPRIGLAHLVSEAEAELRAQQDRVLSLRRLVEDLTAEHDAVRDREGFIHHTSAAAVRLRLEELALGAKKECVSFNPGGAQPPAAMAASKPLNQRALERGVGIRCVYQDSFRYDPDTLAYARWLTELGGETRCMPTVPCQLVIVDAQVALVPRMIEDPSRGALEIRTPAIVTILTDYFETVWSVADQFGTRVRREATPMSPVTRQMLQILASGATDEAAARRLGLSTRTVRRWMADVMEQLGAESRFQAAVEATRRGWIE